MMPDQDVLMPKFSRIQDCLDRINDKIDGKIANVDDLDIQDIVIINLQRATQLTINIAAHIISSEKLGLPESLKDSFLILGKNNIITNKLADKLIRMVGFRNVAVMEYEKINIEILKSILQHHIKDIEDFYAAVLKHYKISE